MPIQSINPATAEVVKTFEEEEWESVQVKLENAQRAFYTWRDLNIENRAEIVGKMARVLRDRREEYAKLMTMEMGKPIVQGRAEVEKCAWACEYAAQMGPEWLKKEVVNANPGLRDVATPKTSSAATPPRNDNLTRAYVRFDPLGVILAVMPWNFPFWQFFRFAAGALTAGNTIVLKHASNVPQCALAIEEIFKKAGAPDGLVQTVLVGGDAVASIIADPRIAAVTLTGSTAAGKKVAGTAGLYLKKCVLELGGSDPFIVCADADIAAAVQAAVTARTINTGQSCIAAKRFIVVREATEEFTSQFVKKMQALVVGDPMDEKTQIGPLARADLVDELDRQVRESVSKGARVLCGGKRREGSGNFYEPTVLADIKSGMPAYDEELFGPVASIIVANDADDAVRIANDSIYGLGAAIWTSDNAKAEKMAYQLECGAVFINDFVKSDPRLPFGGIKQSGYGRELGIYGIREFVNVKTVVVK
ncbi:NAD-dependent succinate-semialdehyde dehydrogenase [Candidatus Uhrbacteria bacterium]|nr:NAD-dependent succinate-semialdehyde dehydrogenase [Candidatus Uhrbacteria bacterium]